LAGACYDKKKKAFSPGGNWLWPLKVEAIPVKALRAFI